MAFGENLSVRISAQTRDFESGVEDARDKLSKFRTSAVTTSGSLQLLQGRADEAEDEISSVGRSATTSSLSLSALGASAKGAGVSLSGLSTTLVVGLIPTLALLSTTLVPITAALGGLAAIVGSIGLVGFAGVLGAVKTNTQSLKEEAQDLLSTVKKEFGPFFDTFAVGLEILINRLEDTISQIAPTQAEASRLAGSFVQLGTALIDTLPALTDLAITLSEEFLPPMVDLARNVLPEVPGFIEGLVDTFTELAPTLSGTGAFLVSLTRELFDLGMTVLRLVTPAFSGVGGAINGLLSRFNDLSGNVQNLGVSVGLLIGPLRILLSILGGPVTLAIAAVTAAVVGLGKAWKTNFAGIRDSLGIVGDQIQRVLPAAQRAFEVFISAIDIESITDSLQKFADILENQLRKSAVALKPVFGDLKQLLKDNKEEFEIIGGAIGGVVRALIGAAQTVLKILGPAFRKVGIPIIRGFITVVDGAISQIANLIKLFNAVKNRNFGKALDISGNIAATGLETAGDLVPTQQIQQTTQQAQQNVRLVIDENTENIKSTIQTEAEGVVVDRERRAKRQTGGTRGF